MKASRLKLILLSTIFAAVGLALYGLTAFMESENLKLAKDYYSRKFSGAPISFQVHRVYIDASDKKPIITLHNNRDLVKWQGLRLMVVTPSGVLGFILVTNKSTLKLETVYNTGFSLKGIIQRNGVRVELSNQSGNSIEIKDAVRMVNTRMINDGDKIITSSFNGGAHDPATTVNTFGYPFGRVTVTRTDLKDPNKAVKIQYRISVLPSVKLKNLAYVAILTPSIQSTH